MQYKAATQTVLASAGYVKNLGQLAFAKKDPNEKLKQGQRKNPQQSCSSNFFCDVKSIPGNSFAVAFCSKLRTSEFLPLGIFVWSSKAMKNVDRGVRISENLFTKIKQTMLNLIINIAVEIFLRKWELVFY